MAPLIVVLAGVLTQAARGDALPVALELAAYEVHVLDPLFARVTVTNTKERRVPLPTDLFNTAQYTLLRLTPPYRYVYEFTSEHVTGTPFFVTLDPQQTMTLDYEILELPAVDQLQHKFWREIGKPADDSIVARLFCFPQNEPPVPVRAEASRSIEILERGAEEMEFLRELCAESAKRDQENRGHDDWRELSSTPVHFGLKRFRSDRDLVEKLLAYEEHLSPGSLRDVVHVVRVTGEIDGSRDDPQREAMVEGLLEWLDTLPEIERHCLAMSIISWATSRSRGDEPPFHSLVYGAAQRLPEQYHPVGDLPKGLVHPSGYRAYRLRQYENNHPEFQAYLKTRSDPYLEN
jgi:hypothetical protein